MGVERLAQAERARAALPLRLRSTIGYAVKLQTAPAERGCRPFTLGRPVQATVQAFDRQSAIRIRQIHALRVECEAAQAIGTQFQTPVQLADDVHTA